MKTVHNFKDKAILFGWVLGLLGMICLIWISSQSLQTRYLLRTVNSVFRNNADVRRVSAYLPHKAEKADVMGYWYSMYNSSDMMFVFTFFKDGILIPLGAIISDNGSVSEIIPLSAHAEQTFDNLPKSILQMYAARIEAASPVNRTNTGGISR